MQKTLKLKKAEPASPASASASSAPAQEGSIFVSSRHANPLEGAPVAPASKGSWTWAAVVGILAFLLLVALCAVGYMDWTGLRFA